MNSVVSAAANRVFEVLGAGHSESTYQNALRIELEKSPDVLRVLTEVTFPILYEGIPVGFQRADVIIQFANGSNALLELKSVVTITQNVFHQVRRYMEQYTHARISSAAIVNFGQQDVQVVEVVRGS
jgi:GxxExxY protein